MKSFFQDLIKEIELSENYLKENQGNLPITEKIAKTLKLDSYQSRILCYVFYLKVVKSCEFDNKMLKNLVDMREKEYLRYINAVEELFVKRLIIFISQSYDWEGTIGFFNSKISINGILFNFFMYGDLPDFEKEKFETPYDLADFVSDVYVRLNELNLGRRKTYSYMDLQLGQISLRLSEKFPFFHVVKKFSAPEIMVLGLLLNTFSETESYSVSLKKVLLTKVGQVLRLLLFGRNSFKKSKLFKSGLVVLENSENVNEQVLALSDKALKAFFGVSKKSLIVFSMLDKTSKIKKKDLFFNKNVEQTVCQIENILTQRMYRKFCSLSQKKKLNPSISVLLYGKPGTGKTEFVYQIARKTKREVLKLDVAKCISKWIGDSEKNIREIFSEYKKSLRGYSRQPILLLNEADAFLSERIAVRDSVDQTYNDLRNIFLEEMENFEGILFATTNLIDNLDTAFFRRFGFKIRFDLPDKETRVKIWKSKIPYLSDYYADVLSEFPLSGGDIDNVLKKLLVASVVNPELKEEEVLIKLAGEEAEFKVENKENSRLGFKVV